MILLGGGVHVNSALDLGGGMTVFTLPSTKVYTECDAASHPPYDKN